MPAAAASNAGGIFWDSDDNALMYSDGSKWTRLTGLSAGGQLPAYGTAGNMLRDSGAAWVTTAG